MKALLFLVLGALFGSFLLLLLLLGLERLWNGWPAAAVLIALMFFPAFWLLGGMGRLRVADARERGGSAWLGLLGLDCPRCGHTPMSALRKWRLGGRGTARCRHCGLLLTNDTLPAILLLAPLLASLLMAPVIGAVVRAASPIATIGWLLAAGGVAALFIALTRPFLACEPLAPPAGADAPDLAPTRQPSDLAP